MIKLETKNTAPSAVAVLELRSSGDAPTVILATGDHGAFVGEEWKPAIQGKKRQQVTFIGSDGSPCTIEGVVDESEAVEIAAAHKVVVQVRVANVLLAAKAIGRTSKESTRLDVVRVVEVWDTPTRCLWKAENARPAGATMDASGKIIKAA